MSRSRWSLLGLFLVPLAACDDDDAVIVATRAFQAVQVSAGEAFTCAVAEDADAFCWGSDLSGRLGNGARGSSDLPDLVVGDIAFASVTAGGAHACALAEDGSAFCWGDNSEGQLGDGTNVNRDAPVAVAGGLDFDVLSAGDAHTCGVTTDGTALCWGANEFGQLGNGTTVNSNTPVQVSNGGDFASISAGLNHTCAIEDDAADAGDAFCWGSNVLGELGIGNAVGPELCAGDPCSTVPVAVVGDLEFESVSAAFAFTCGVADDSSAFCWGSNIFGELGAPTSEVCADDDSPCSTVPVEVAGNRDFALVSGGGFHTCGVTDDDDAFCWGDNDEGQLGNGTNQASPVPSAVARNIDWNSVDAGFEHTCGIGDNSVVFCWGDGEFGQLGNGSTVDRSRPEEVRRPPLIT